MRMSDWSSDVCSSDLASEYGGDHRPPGVDSAPAYDLTGGGTVYPDDVYGPKADIYYGHFGGGHQMDRETIRILHALRGKPNAKVTIYRADRKSVVSGKSGSVRID